MRNLGITIVCLLEGIMRRLLSNLYLKIPDTRVAMSAEAPGPLQTKGISEVDCTTALLNQLTHAFAIILHLE